MDVYHEETTVEEVRSLLEESVDARIRHPLLERLVDADTLLEQMDGTRDASVTVSYDGAHPERSDDYRDPEQFSASIAIPTGHALNPVSRLRVTVDGPAPYHEDAVEGLYDAVVEERGWLQRVRTRLNRFAPGYPDAKKAAENLQRFTEYLQEL